MNLISRQTAALIAKKNAPAVGTAVREKAVLEEVRTYSGSSRFTFFTGVPSLQFPMAKVTVSRPSRAASRAA